MERTGLTLFLILSLASSMATAQMFESFEYGVPPPGWIKTNLQGGTGWYQLPIGWAPLPGWGNGTSSVPATAGAGTHNAGTGSRGNGVRPCNLQYSGVGG